jgi:hypothetical protein
VHDLQFRVSNVGSKIHILGFTVQGCRVRYRGGGPRGEDPKCVYKVYDESYNGYKPYTLHPKP